jgi:hypothetical protein
MKPTANFKMNATTKYLLSTIVDADQRNTFKTCMIQAQLAAEKKPEPSKSKRD